MTAAHPRQLTNPPSETELAGLALRYVGDDALYDDHPGTFLESPQMKAEIPDLGLRGGEPFRGELFPQVWPGLNSQDASSPPPEWQEGAYAQSRNTGS